MTIKDIAKKANVSVATVSRVLNDYKWVSNDVRMRVLKVIEQENYHPNYCASVMATGRSKVIIIVVPDIVSPFFAQFTGIVTKRMRSAGYATILYQTNNEIEEEVALFSSPFARMAEGIISVTDGMENELLLKLIKPLREKNKPIIFLDRFIPTAIADSAKHDNIGGMRKAVELLHKNGHRQIAMISGNAGLTVVHDKLKGFRSAMRALSIPVNEKFIRSGDWTVKTGIQETAKLLQMRTPPTAIIAGNNFICEGILQELDRRNLVPGKDISIIGVEESDSDERLFSKLGITTLKLDCTQMALYASNYMLQELLKTEPKNYFTTTEHVVELIERNSVVNLLNKRQEDKQCNP